tara:strand:+ start:408 stop:752 length:345 start_codon:yes stop_codon:yes gene_type:complete
MIILWIISIASLSVGLIIAIPNAVIPILWYYNKWVKRREVYLGSRLPLFGAPFLFLGTVLLPIELPLNRVLMACLVACFDISIIDIPIFFLVWFIRGRPDLTQDTDKTDSGATP